MECIVVVDMTIAVTSASARVVWRRHEDDNNVFSSSSSLLPYFSPIERCRRRGMRFEEEDKQSWQLVHLFQEAHRRGSQEGREARNRKTEQLWHQFFADPSQWWDNRFTKKNAKQPDFKHKRTLEALWMNCWWNPSWVKERLHNFDSIAHIKQRNSSCSDGEFEMAQQLCKEGRLKDAINLVECMAQQASIENAPNATYISLLKECAKRKMLTEGKQIHALIVQSNSESNILLANNLIRMYSKCGSLQDACMVFNAMPVHDVFSWTAIISAYAQNGLGRKAIALYTQMRQEGMEANGLTFVCVLKACASIGALEQGKQIHALILKKGFHLDIVVQNALVDMYGKCGCIDSARDLFNKISERNVVSWNAMIAGYAQNGLGKEAIALYKQMKQEGVDANVITFVCVLKACASTGALEQGKQIHSLILGKGFHPDIVVQNALVDMYAKCGCLENARDLFSEMSKRDVVSWSAMIAGYAQNGLAMEAIALYKQMKQEGVDANGVTFVCVLKACAIIGALEQGKQIHFLIVEKGFHLDIVVQNALVDMYAKCGCVENARDLFNKMSKRNVVSWSAMIAAYAQNGLGKEAIALYKQMKQEGVEANGITFVSVLKACASMGALEQGKQIHSLILDKGFHLDIVVQIALFDMYAKCGCLENARDMFNKMSKRNVVSWSAMIGMYAQNGFGMEAIALYKQMKEEGVDANGITFVCVLKACASIGALEQGKKMHSLILEKGLHLDIVVQNALVDMYAKCGCLDSACDLFNKMSIRNVVSWSTMIAAYTQNGLGMEAIALYKQMKQEGVEPNGVTFVSVLKACASIGALEQGKQIHSLILEKGFNLDIVVQNALVHMYAKCRCLDNARDLFNKMSRRNVVSWSAMIAAYAQNGLGMEAIALYKQLKEEGVEANGVTCVCILKACASVGALEQGKQIHSLIVEKGFHMNIIVQNALVDMYAKCGCLDNARHLFYKMSERNVVSWNAIIAGNAQDGFGMEAIALYKQMKQEGVEANGITFVCVLKACASIGALEQGKQIHSLILKKGFHLDIVVQNALIDMYAKCGCLDNARDIFNKMIKRDVVSWNAMISGYAQNGLGLEAIALYTQMKQEGMEVNSIQPDDITYTCVLSACSHFGLLNEGFHVFDFLCRYSGVISTLKHYACMVDLLGRAGLLVEAKDFIRKMPIHPDRVVWMSLLGAARNIGNLEIGQHAFYNIVKLDPQNAAPYLLLLDMFARVGQMDKVAEIRKVVTDKGLKRIPGCSWIEVDNQVHAFVVGNESRLQSQQIWN